MRALTLFLVLSFFLVEIINAQSLKIQNWTYIPIDSTKQKWGDWNDPDWLRYFGLDFCDVNRDGNIDIISGRYIYHNPGGTMEGLWQRTVLDDNVDAIFSIDADGDQYSDIIAQALPDIYWYEAINEQGTRYKRTAIASIPATSHVNSQGFEKAQILPGGPTELLIAGNGNIYCISIPEQIQSSEQLPTYLEMTGSLLSGIPGINILHQQALLFADCPIWFIMGMIPAPVIRGIINANHGWTEIKLLQKLKVENGDGAGNFLMIMLSLTL